LGIVAPDDVARSALAAMTESQVVAFDHDLRCVSSTGEPLPGAPDPTGGLPGQLLADVMSSEAYQRFEPYCRAALRGGRTKLDHQSLDGAYIYDVRIAPVDSEGQVVGGVIVSRDITEARRTREALARSEREHRDLAERSTDVVTRTDDRAIYRYVSPSCARVYGYDPEELVGRPVRDFVHPDDRSAHAEMRASLTDGDAEHFGQLRHAHKAGHWVWVELQYAALRDGAGRLIGVQGAARDITDRKVAEAARAIADDQFRTAFDGAPIGMALVAPDGRMLRVNEAMCSIVGYTPGELLARSFQEITHPDDLAADVAQVEAILSGQGSLYESEKRYVRADGTVVWAALAVSLVRDSGGRPLHLVSQVQDISERRRLEAQLRHLADRDGLTGLHNRRSFQRQLDHQVARAHRYGELAAVLVLDLDAFKDVNDSLGHHAGDELLKHVSRVLQQRLRDSDIIGRLGGDEFAVLLPAADLDRAQRVVAALKRELAESPVLLEGVNITVQASIGLAALTRDLDGEGALKVADQAMYLAKSARAGHGDA
jgi:diguanylate cyclase (GGDEF)-like protein/PAS domain S-box-containing protein